jgi:hypothetical protein
MSLGVKFSRKPHPASADHEVVEWDTKVHHQLCVPRGVGGADVVKEIVKYLRGYDVEADGRKEHVMGYEDIYPETIEPGMDEIIKRGVLPV